MFLFTRLLLRFGSLKIGLLAACLVAAGLGIASDANAAGPMRGPYAPRASGYDGYFRRGGPHDHWRYYGRLRRHQLPGFSQHMRHHGYDSFTRGYHPRLRSPSYTSPRYSPGLRRPGGFRP